MGCRAFADWDIRFTIGGKHEDKRSSAAWLASKGAQTRGGRVKKGRQKLKAHTWSLRPRPSSLCVGRRVSLSQFWHHKSSYWYKHWQNIVLLNVQQRFRCFIYSLEVVAQRRLFICQFIVKLPSNWSDEYISSNTANLYQHKSYHCGRCAVEMCKPLNLLFWCKKCVSQFSEVKKTNKAFLLWETNTPAGTWTDVPQHFIALTGCSCNGC